MKRLLNYVSLGFLTYIILIVPAFAQNFQFDFGSGPSSTGRLLQFIALVSLLSLAPSIFVMLTSFTRIVIVLSFLRNALSTQTTPPNTVLISLALFLTFFIMNPTLKEAYELGIEPLINNEIDESQAFERASAPLHEFMREHVREEDVQLFMEVGEIKDVTRVEDIPMHVLIPAFMISELRHAFEIGFLIFLPFLVIDLVVASILMSMGMMMLPPVMISLPFKIIFFVLIDGWHMVVGSLIRSF